MSLKFKFKKTTLGLVALSLSSLGSASDISTSQSLADWANAASTPNKHVVTTSYRRSSYNPYNGIASTAVVRQATYSPSNKLTSRERYPVGKPTFQCVVEAAARQKVPPDLLLAINSVERGSTGQYVGNKNGTKDIGAFQINSIHLPRARLYKASANDLATRGCYNAEFAALLLHEALTHPRMQNKSFYTRASGYHSWTPTHNAVYKRKLISYLSQWQKWLKENNMSSLVVSPPP